MPVWTWGSDVYGRLGHGTEDAHRGRPTEVKALAKTQLAAATCGSAHNVVVDKAGQVLTWGKCHYGQLGHGEMDQNELVPRPVEALRGVQVRRVAAGDSHVLAVTAEGGVYTWGVGFYGSLGHGDETSLAVPKPVEKLRGERVASAAGGAFHSLAVTEDGRVFVWGRDHCGQLGRKAVRMPDYSAGGKGTKLVRLNQKEPVELELPSNPSGVISRCKVVSACNNHSLLLLESGIILSFGANDLGQLGRKDTPDDSVSNFQIDPSHFQDTRGTAEDVSFIAAGWSHCAAITASGLLYTWGEGRHGQLGLGHTRGSASPHLVEDFQGKSSIVKFSQVSCGDSFTVAMTSTGHLWAFGSPDYGKLGVEAGGCVTVPKPLPTQLPGLTSFCCGTNHTLAYTLVLQ